MTCDEFSNAFDVLLSSYKYNPEFGNDFSSVDLTFDEYEKSVFLTKAQEELVLTYYSGNQGNDAFEQTEEIRRYLSNLKKHTSLEKSDVIIKLSNYSKIPFTLPNDVLFITYEELLFSFGLKLVTPVNEDELYKTIQNPFKFNPNRCLRLDGADNIIYIITNISFNNDVVIDSIRYNIGYLAKPKPIILIDLEEVSINGETQKTECELHESLHNKIIDRAVALAIASKSIIQK